MFTLRVLGGFALEGPEGAGVNHLSQRRAEAVLALLAVAGDLGCTRDRLIAFLWPESDQDRGRHSLRDALHAIRKVLGADVILTGVGETLRLNPEVVTSDVRRFAQSVVSSPQADAVEAYRGPLLDGFHLDGAPEFERWLDAERSRLFHQCQEAIAKLAGEAERVNHWREAAQWWAQALGLDPFNTRVVVRRMGALARAGDRVNALKEGEAHRVRLVRELELEPDPAFLQEIERVRRGDLGPPVFRTPTEGTARPWVPPKSRD